MFEQKGSPYGEAGQTLLIVVLVVIVVSTIGLSVATRSITSLRISTEEAESQKALAAAEAGIERAIQAGTLAVGVDIQGGNASNKSHYIAKVGEVNEVKGSSFLLTGGSKILDPVTKNVIGMIPNAVPKDEGADVWFVNRDANGNPDYVNLPGGNLNSLKYLNLYWKSSSVSSENCNNASTAPPAIEAIVVSRKPSTGEIKTYRYTYDSCSVERGNNFTKADFGNYDETISGIKGVPFTNKTPNDNLANNIKDIVLVRVIPIYKDAVIAVSACNGGGQCDKIDLPSQGNIITSTGVSGQASRKIVTFKGYPQASLSYLSSGLFVADNY